MLFFFWKWQIQVSILSLRLSCLTIVIYCVHNSQKTLSPFYMLVSKQVLYQRGYLVWHESNTMSKIMHTISFHHRSGKVFYKSLGTFLRTLSQQLIMVFIVQPVSPCMMWPLPGSPTPATPWGVTPASSQFLQCVQGLCTYCSFCLAHFGSLSLSPPHIPTPN